MVAPLALLVSFVVVILALLAVMASRNQNFAAEAGERVKIHDAIRAELDKTAQQMDQITLLHSGIVSNSSPQQGDVFLARTTQAMREAPEFDEFYAVASGAATFGASEGSLIEPGAYRKYAAWVEAALAKSAAIANATLRGTLAQAAAPQKPHADSAAFALFETDAAYFVAAHPPPRLVLAENPDAAMFVGVRRVSSRLLLEIGRAAGVNGLALAPDAGPSDASLQLDIPAIGQTPAVLAWTPRRPGDAFLAYVSVAMVVMTALFAALIAVHTRRVMSDLTDSEARARHIAGHDQLSGLSNRRLFAEILDHEIELCILENAGFALFYFDLDRFKEINDTLGHDAGDDVIREVAQRIESVIGPGDVMARIGGDEFALLARGRRTAGDCAALAERILVAMRAPFRLRLGEMRAGLSIGIARCPADAADRAELMRKSDIALYRAKQNGRSRYVLFDAAMDADLSSAKTLEDDLRAALAQSGLALRYQPTIAADGKKLTGVEALACWPHATLGLIPPDRFIPLAEERGLIPALGAFVLRQAMTDGLTWPSLRVAVNISPSQLRAADFVSQVKRCLAETGFPPTRLEIELTEGILQEHAAAAQTAMAQLRAIGVRLTLDDFGSGASSLLHVRGFRFDKIKIARAFLPGIENGGANAAILRSLVSLGRALGMTVAVKGVETRAQLRLLQAYDCHELQGYLFSAAQPADAISRMTAAPPRDAKKKVA